MKIILKLLTFWIPVQSWRKRLRNQLRLKFQLMELKFDLIRLQKKFSEYIIISSLTSLGDIFLLGLMIKELKQQYRKKVVILYNQNTKTLDTLKLFKDDVDIFYPISHAQWLFLLQNKVINYKILQCGKIHPIGAEQRQSFTKVNNYIENFSKNALLITHKPILSIPPLPSNDKLKLADSRTVLLLPYSVTFNCKKISQDFWYGLIDKLENKGFKVVINTKKDDILFQKYTTIFLPIIEQIEYAKSCYAIVGVRSGIMDIFSFYNVSKLISVYPPNLEESFITDKNFYMNLISQINESNYQKKKLEFYSISKAFNNKNWLDIIFENDTKTADIIVNNIQKDNGVCNE